MRIIKKPILKSELKSIAEERFGDLVKAAVDIDQEIIAVGGELHVDEEVLLIEQEGSKQENVWGVNIYPDNSGDDFIEFDSMVNLKPAFGNRSRGIDDSKIREKVITIIKKLVI
ncbi:MAG: hypothetical protein HYW77_00800 [Parcubacteria group bacterium]|nr:hypothetical protein [Parcubacteria group bacterium]